MWFLLILCLGLPLSLAINLTCLHRLCIFLYHIHCSCNGCNFEQFLISVSKMHAQFQGCWHKKARTPMHDYYYCNSRSNEKDKRKQHTLSVFPICSAKCACQVIFFHGGQTHLSACLTRKIRKVCQAMLERLAGLNVLQKLLIKM